MSMVTSNRLYSVFVENICIHQTESKNAVLSGYYKVVYTTKQGVVIVRLKYCFCSMTKEKYAVNA